MGLKGSGVLRIPLPLLNPDRHAKLINGVALGALGRSPDVSLQSCHARVKKGRSPMIAAESRRSPAGCRARWTRRHLEVALRHNLHVCVGTTSPELTELEDPQTNPASLEASMFLKIAVLEEGAHSLRTVGSDTLACIRGFGSMTSFAADSG